MKDNEDSRIFYDYESEEKSVLSDIYRVSVSWPLGE